MKLKTKEIDNRTEIWHGKRLVGIVEKREKGKPISCINLVTNECITLAMSYKGVIQCLKREITEKLA